MNKEDIHERVISTPIGPLCLQAKEGKIIAIFPCQIEESRIKEEPDPLLNETERQLQEYFALKREQFTFPVDMIGTSFQKKVWKALCEIPYGKTCSYQEIAMKINHPKACRAVGGAIHRNPILIAVPCHRVIGKNGDLVGFGCGLPMKKALLLLEKSSQKKEIML